MAGLRIQSRRPLTGDRTTATFLMSLAKQVTASAFELAPSERLLKVLEAHHIEDNLIVPLLPDVALQYREGKPIGQRTYFRVPWKKGTAVAAVYPEPFDPDFHPYLDVTRLFLENDVPVPEIYSVDGQSGIIVQEDLGDR